MVQVQSNAPSVSCFITKSKNRLKIYKSNEKETVYLNDNDNFELEFSNLSKDKVMAKIYINNKLISSQGIVINPGQTNFLERFIEDNKKFIYNTYKVEKDNKSIDEAISNNGVIKVEFYNESHYWSNTGTSSSWVHPNHWITYTTPNWTTNPTIVTPIQPYCNTINTVFGTTTTNINNGSITNGSFTYTSGINSININQPETKETGIVNKGEESKQEFKNTNTNFNYFPFLTKEIQILPISEKQIEFKEIRNYCAGCGYRMRQDTWKFCPKCGEKL